MNLARIIGAACTDDLFCEQLMSAPVPTTQNFGFAFASADAAELLRIFPVSDPQGSSAVADLCRQIADYICPKRICPGLAGSGAQSAIGTAVLDDAFREAFLTDPINAAAHRGIDLTSAERFALARLVFAKHPDGIPPSLKRDRLRVLFKALGQAITRPLAATA
ncbi:MAG TPA: Os1348 family NHLP clan protein [Terriglobales bacterium]|nr:Os1348 family NHLP clan protein [Terriglobales bacterium]